MILVQPKSNKIGFSLMGNEVIFRSLGICQICKQRYGLIRKLSNIFLLGEKGTQRDIVFLSESDLSDLVYERKLIKRVDLTVEVILFLLNTCFNFLSNIVLSIYVSVT